MINLKRTVWAVVGVILLASIIYLGAGVADYISFKNIAQSAGGMPWQDGGKITMVIPVCILDTPTIAPVTCAASCPFVTSAVGTLCTAYIEIRTQSQFGTTFIAAPKAFQYGGGGTFPVAGMSYLAGGASNAIPWVIGIPSSPGARIQKIINWFDYGIASFKDKIK